MFYLVRGLKTTLRIEPNYLDQLKDQKFLQEQIVQKLEGKYFQDVGYIICITKCLNISQSDEMTMDALIEEDGSIKCVVTFEAFTFQLRENDIVDCEVTKCEAECLYAKLGPIQLVIPRDVIPANLQFTNECYKDQDEEVIRSGSKLRVQIQKTNYKNGVLRGYARLCGDKVNNVCGVLNDELKF